MYNKNNLYTEYIQAKGIIVSKVRSNETDTLRYLIMSKYCKIFAYASNTLDIISSEISSKKINSPSVRKSAKVLDQFVDVLAERRFRTDFGQKLPMTSNPFLKKINESREMFGQDLLGTKFIVNAKIPLTSTNDNLQQIILNNFSLKKFYIKKQYFNAKKISAIANIPSELIDVNPFEVISVGEFDHNYESYHIIIPSKNVSFNQKNESFQMQAISIPFSYDIINLSSGTKKSEDIIIPNENTKKFLINYSKNVANPDDMIMLVRSEVFLDKKPSFSGISQDLLERSAKNNSFEIKISQIKRYSDFSGDSMWPPQNNLIFNQDVANSIYESLGVKFAEKTRLRHSDEPADWTRFDEAYEDYIKVNPNEDLHEIIMSNLNNFPISTSKITVLPASKLGVIIPIKYESENVPNRLSTMSNVRTSVRSSGSFSSSIVDKKIVINADSGKRIDISWAFKTPDPQIEDEEGNVKTTLVQSGIVQKLHFLDSMMKKQYTDMLREYSRVKEYSKQTKEIKNLPFSFIQQLLKIRNYYEKDNEAILKISSFESFLEIIYCSS
jgi:hypothetical protein